MGLFATCICARGCVVPKGGFDDGFVMECEAQFGEWHCLSILGADSGESWNYPCKIAGQMKCAAITAECVDSDFALIHLFIDGEEINRFTLGESYDGEQAEPDYELWKPFETGGRALKDIVDKAESYVFIEEALIELKEVFGFPLLVLPKDKKDA